ncbi:MULTISPECIES: glycine betaine ABC transporter substrate-binding protein [unclassified Nocardiopsis]|uniref:glycine betaine ABC transporter substrate-binding protein n=1 Tax=unclassified Nocardiopsis TaxID=2649073 RepID=UPI00066ECD4F|nr:MULTISPECIES: glycine betaine ABC transporter substrate-binding protein [unclassified Nocardiopsis]MBQ1082412.1 glycine betaine ABC transporter substrate-binding protein [Nocardiopsis sp. B62]
MKRRGTGLAAAGLSGVLLLSACSGEADSGGPDDGDDLREVNIALIAWEEAIAVTHMWEAVLEEKGYDVTVTEVDVAPAFQGVADGELDLYLDMWLPVTHHEYMEQHRDSIESLGSWYDNAVLTLTVPEYMEDVREIDDLPARADELGGTIVGIEPGAGLTQVTRDQAMPLYGLEEDFELETSSGGEMMRRLDEAILEERPIVVTLWRPHPAYAQYELRDLEDPQGGMGGTEGLHSIGRAGFSEDYPELAEWMRNWTMDDEELASLEALTVGPGVTDPAAGAREWLAQNPLFLERTLMDAAEGLEF